jgi:hypothetical protein
MSLLDPVVHARLLADIEGVCAMANIPRHMLHSSASEYCGPSELEWLTNYPVNKASGKGLLMTGKFTNPSPETRMMAMAGAFLRNFVDARLIPLNSLLEMVEDKVDCDATVLLVPNLYLRQGGKTLPSWKMQQMYDHLLGRLTAGKLTVLYVEDMQAMAAEYGPAFLGHLTDHYREIHQ